MKHVYVSNLRNWLLVYVRVYNISFQSCHESWPSTTQNIQKNRKNILFFLLFVFFCCCSVNGYHDCMILWIFSYLFITGIDFHTKVIVWIWAKAKAILIRKRFSEGSTIKGHQPLIKWFVRWNWKGNCAAFSITWHKICILNRMYIKRIHLYIYFGIFSIQ